LVAWLRRLAVTNSLASCSLEVNIFCIPLGLITSNAVEALRCENMLKVEVLTWMKKTPCYKNKLTCECHIFQNFSWFCFDFCFFEASFQPQFFALNNRTCLYESWQWTKQEAVLRLAKANLNCNWKVKNGWRNKCSVLIAWYLSFCT
jgi:hypothetical protein